MRSFHHPGRSPVYGANAMCATSHPAATLAAVNAMRDGGNAVDAAVTAAAVLAVVEPQMTGIGGDCFAQVWSPESGLRVLSGAGRAPAGISIDALNELGVHELTTGSPHAVTVPGAIDAWAQLQEDFGRFGLGRCLEPAIAFARDGFTVAPRVQADWVGEEEKLSRQEGARMHLLRSGHAPSVGDVVKFPALAETLDRIARYGRAGFYEGPVAEDIVSELRALGGLHTMDDFAAQRSAYVEPISINYDGADILELPPSNVGITALIMLKVLDRLKSELPREPLSTKRYHILMEVARQAYQVRDTFVADPEMADVPVAHMLSDAFANELAGRIDPERRQDDLGPVPEPSGSDTVYFSVVDNDGMAVSFINSIYSAFGSGIVTRKTGIVLHNRGEGFRLDPGHRNCIAPRKRPMHTLVPAMAMRGGKPWLVFGVMGAAFQPMGQVYVLTNIADYGMDPQEAIDFPRIFFEDGVLGAERSVPEQIVRELAEMGHAIEYRDEPWGGGQAISIDRARGILIAGSDPRKDGLALGY